MNPPAVPVWLVAGAALVAGTALGWLLRRPKSPPPLAPAAADAEATAIALRRELAAERARATDFAAIASDWWWEMDADLRFSFISGRFEEAFGVQVSAVLGKRREELRRADYDDPKWAAHRATLAARQPFRDFETTFVDGKGEVRYVVISGRPRFDDAGTFLGYRGTSIDVTPVKRLQIDALRRAEVLEATIENLDEGIILFDKDLRIMAFNQKMMAFVGVPAGKLRTGMSFEEGLRSFAAAGAYAGEDPEEAVQRRLAYSRKPEPMSIERTTDRGRTLLIATQPLPGGGMIMKYEDVTEARKREAGIRQAQKMEALGQLTGGIAHDFNNLLTVILGTADLLADGATAAPQGADGDAAARRRQAAATIQRAAERGADLTRRLLAFARQQPLDPHRVDCNRLIEGMGAMLAQTLGEHIEMQLAAAPDLWPAEIDAPLLETSLLNLAINARDAMPKGGRLSIATDNFTVDPGSQLIVPPPPPGDYVVIAVSDSGAGMNAEVRARAFDPFFTTKSVGKGSGLGLSMVYGFVRQSGGFVTLYSEPGHGTVVRLYFPRAGAGEVAAPAAPEPAAALAAAAGTIMVVEDDPLVRGHVDMMLKGLGYRTVVAENGPAAIELLRQGHAADLIFTDMVMPGGMSGRDLVEAARAIRPGLRALVTSGYTDDAIFADDRGKADLDFIAKPYRRAELAERLRRILSQVPGQSA